eukprot:6213068-Pleurochrysis_carterae.AAC.2
MKQPGKDADRFEGDGQSDTPEKYVQIRRPVPVASRTSPSVCGDATGGGTAWACAAAQRALRSVRRVSRTHSERSAADRSEIAHMPKF